MRFIEPMTALETRFYVQTRLEQASVSEDLRGRFNEAALSRIYGLSGGVPRRVHDLARSLLDDAPEGVGSAWREERWLGAPIDNVDESLPRNPADRSDLGGEDADLDLSERLLEEDGNLDLL